MGDNLMVHIRFWYYHLQIGEKFSSICLKKNIYFLECGLKGNKKIEIFKFFKYTKNYGKETK